MNNEPQYLQIRATKDYSIFSDFPTNRTPNEDHIRTLKSKFSEQNLFFANPIITYIDEKTDKLWILDGKHRKEAAQILKEYIYYVVIPKEFIDTNKIPRTIVMLNTGLKNWTDVDYLNAYVKDGNENYKRVKDFWENHKEKFGLTTAYQIIADIDIRPGNGGKEFKLGQYICTDDQVHKANILIAKALGFLPYCQTQGITYGRYHLKALKAIFDNEHRTQGDNKVKITSDILLHKIKKYIKHIENIQKKELYKVIDGRFKLETAQGYKDIYERAYNLGIKWNDQLVGFSDPKKDFIDDENN